MIFNSSLLYAKILLLNLFRGQNLSFLEQLQVEHADFHHRLHHLQNTAFRYQHLFGEIEQVIVVRLQPIPVRINIAK